MLQDIWGYCEECGRWFACDGWFDRAAPHPVCPVCASEPRTIVNRAATGGLTGAA